MKVNLNVVFLLKPQNPQRFSNLPLFNDFMAFATKCSIKAAQEAPATLCIHLFPPSVWTFQANFVAFASKCSLLICLWTIIFTFFSQVKLWLQSDMIAYFANEGLVYLSAFFSVMWKLMLKKNIPHKPKVSSSILQQRS